MKKYIFISTIIFALFLALPATAKSEDAGPKGIHEPGNGLAQEKNLNITNTEDEDIDEDNDDKEDVEEENEEKATSSEENAGGENPTAFERRSRVANAVQEILNSANRVEGGIGAQVREIAQTQKQNHEEIEINLEKIKNQNRFFRFLFGSKAKDVDELKTQIQSSTSKIEDLKTAIKEMTNEEVKTRLQAQVDTLEQVKSQIANEVDQENSEFSLFGWVKKLFK